MSILAQPNLPTPLLVTEKPRKQAKAALRGVGKAENALWKKWGEAVSDVRHSLRLNLQEFAGELEKDERQVGRWEAGIERPQVELLLAKPRLAGPMLIALAQREQNVTVDTVIHVRRSVA